MYSLLRPFLFSLESEKSHNFALKMLHYLPNFYFKQPKEKEVSALGFKFAHPIGLAAGLDKNGEHLNALAKIGFSFIELGTVTPKPQAGNPKPRLFRLPEASALINRMGFNNQGVDALVANVQGANYQGILGINIGKNKDTPLNQATEDYLHCLRKVYPLASYVTVNISSPNTPDLRLLQQKDFFQDLLIQLTEETKRLAEQFQRRVPLLIKISPDESDESLKEMADFVLEMKLSGIIATNTTLSKEVITHLEHGEEQGGLSGRPLFDRSTECIRLLKQRVGRELTLIGVGGIDSSETAKKKLEAGADLLQVYTGLIYEGPGLVNQILKNL